jgi:tetratricopeptide (TPR) repeat protein/serine phosphatase RsbU (regulator of sigma subunit)
MNFISRCFFIGFVLFSFHMKAQQREIDSLYKVIKSNQSDTAVASAYVMLTEYIGYIYPDTVLPLCRKALAITDKHTSYKSPAEKKSFLKSRSNALNNMGLIYMNQGDISKALDHYYKSLNIMEENADKPGIVLCLNNIGGIYRNQGDNIQALDYYFRALKLAKEIGDKDGTAFSLGNIGVIYLNQKRFDQALSCYLKSLAIRESIDDEEGTAMSLGNIGLIYENKKEYKKALDYYLRSLEKLRDQNDKDGISYTLSNIGTIYLKENDLKRAYDAAKESLELAKEINFPEDIRDASNVLQNIYRKQNKWKEALEMQDLFISMRDSINNEETQKAATKKQLKYQYEKDKLALEKEQEKKDVIRREEKRQQRLVTYSVTGVLFLVLVFSLFLYNRFRVTNKQKKIIVEQKHIVEEKQKEIIDSIHYAQRIQSTLLAQKELLNSNLPEYFILFRPKDIVSGDFYWATKKDNLFYFAVCDSTGHGVPGAFMSLLNVSFLNEAVNEKNIRKPNEILDYVRNRLITAVSQDGGQDGMDGILVCIENLNNENQLSVTYAAAYNAPVIIKNGELNLPAADKMPVGKGEKKSAFTLQTLDVKKGDIVYLFTDGYADQFGGPKGKKFKYKQLYDSLLSVCDLPVNMQKEALSKTFDDWKGDIEQVDDVCIVGLKL